MRSWHGAGGLMVFMAVFSLVGFGGMRASTAGIVIAASMFVGGGALLSGRRWTVFPALVGALAMVGGGIAALRFHPAWGLPIPPMVSAAVGAILVLRVLHAQNAMAERDRQARRRESQSSESSDGMDSEEPKAES